MLAVAGNARAGTPLTFASEYKRAAGPHEVAELRFDWHDSARDRDVPVKVYCPARDPGPFPVILFSHGLGGSREGYAYAGRHWASHGYVCVHLQHPGSDETVWKGLRPAEGMEAMRAALAQPANAVHRPLDVRFVIDRLEALQLETGLPAGRMDLARIGMAGHSFGAFTTLAVIGKAGRAAVAGRSRVADPRIKAAVIMSPTVSPDSAHDREPRTYAGIGVPCFHLTGTLDDAPINNSRAADRRIPFDLISGPDQYLVIFTGGDHMVFSGRRGPRGDGRLDPLFHDLIRMSTTAFWDAYLKQDAGARAWLAEGGFGRALGNHGTFETRPADSRPAP